MRRGCSQRPGVDGAGDACCCCDVGVLAGVPWVDGVEVGLVATVVVVVVVVEAGDDEEVIDLFWAVGAVRLVLEVEGRIRAVEDMVVRFYGLIASRVGMLRAVNAC